MYVAKKLKHDRYMECLMDDIKPYYDKVSTNVRLYSKAKKPRVIAEVDIIAEKRGKYDVYEVKCSYRVKKARHQLQKIKKILPNIRNAFFFCGESGALEVV